MFRTVLALRPLGCPLASSHSGLWSAASCRASASPKEVRFFQQDVCPPMLGAMVAYAAPGRSGGRRGRALILSVVLKLYTPSTLPPCTFLLWSSQRLGLLNDNLQFLPDLRLGLARTFLRWASPVSIPASRVPSLPEATQRGSQWRTVGIASAAAFSLYCVSISNTPVILPFCPLYIIGRKFLQII